ncbi:hypothetical protein [Terrihabitans sp. B22-R8]|uniref:hypothetical protein n=1 Tax=Terrihabitans sp. B22-R8 TaxID=3425128 RepID=UPI00403C33D4
MAKEGTFWGRLLERVLSWGDDNRVSGIIKKAHETVEDLTERVENAMPASAHDKPENTDEDLVDTAKTTPLPPPPRKSVAARSPARSRNTAKSPAHNAARSSKAPARKPRGAASEPKVEDGEKDLAPKPAAVRKRAAPLKAVPAEPKDGAAPEPKKPARSRKPSAAKSSVAKDGIEPVEPVVQTQPPASPEIEAPSDVEQPVSDATPASEKPSDADKV